MSQPKSNEEINYETRDYDGIRWIRLDHYEHALAQKDAEAAEAKKEGLFAGIKRVTPYLEHRPRCFLYTEEGDASQCDCGLKEALTPKE